MKTSIFFILSLSLILITSNVYAADCNNCGYYDEQCWKCCLSPHLCPQFEESSAPCGKIGACIQMQHSAPECQDMPRQMPSRCNSQTTTARPTPRPQPKGPRPKPCTSGYCGYGIPKNPISYTG